MFTNEQIRTLNDARLILREAERRCMSHAHDAPSDHDALAPSGWDYGCLRGALDAAADSIFQALNVTNAHHIQNLTDEQLHDINADPGRRYLGNATGMQIDSDERGFELLFETDSGEYRVNIHGAAKDLLDAVTEQIKPWWDDAEIVRRSMRTLSDPREGYDTSDPKHPDFHSVHADLHDSREGK